MGKKVLYITFIWILVGGLLFVLYLQREVTPVKDLIDWAISVWPLITAICLGAIIVSGWIIKHDFGRSKANITLAPPQNNLSRREALESAEIAWGLWHTGARIYIEKLLEMPSLKRVLVLEPNENNKSIGVVAEKAGLKVDTIINQIKDTTDEAFKNGVDIRWYFKDRGDSIIIYDPSPITDNDGVLKPFSENAKIYVEYFNPRVGVDQRKGHWIYNMGKDKKIFKGYCEEYEDIWGDSQKSRKAEAS
jgi:hypothetical protein